VFSISLANAEFFKTAPTKKLDMIAAVVGDALPGSVYMLGEVLSRLKAINPKLAETRKFQKLPMLHHPDNI